MVVYDTDGLHGPNQATLPTEPSAGSLSLTKQLCQTRLAAQKRPTAAAVVRQKDAALVQAHSNSQKHAVLVNSDAHINTGKWSVSSCEAIQLFKLRLRRSMHIPEVYRYASNRLHNIARTISGRAFLAMIRIQGFHCKTSLSTSWKIVIHSINQV